MKPDITNICLLRQIFFMNCSFNDRFGLQTVGLMRRCNFIIKNILNPGLHQLRQCMIQYRHRTFHQRNLHRRTNLPFSASINTRFNAASIRGIYPWQEQIIDSSQRQTIRQAGRLKPGTHSANSGNHSKIFGTLHICYRFTFRRFRKRSERYMHNPAVPELFQQRIRSVRRSQRRPRPGWPQLCCPYRRLSPPRKYP